MSSAALVSSASLPDLVSRGASITEIGAFLDSLSHEARLAQVVGSARSMQGPLYERAAKAEPLTLDYFVPKHVPDGKIVHHHGWNNLPLPAFARRFAKPMGRCPDGSGNLFGYNEGLFGPLIGPGYFLHIPTSHEPSWVERGATVIDYFRVPSHAVPAAWPPVVPTSRGLQMFVYNGTRDFMRRVSAHVTVGAAYKSERAMGAFFMLVRQD